MLASSPSTIAETALELERPERRARARRGRWRRPRSQRLGIGAWLAIIWLVIVILGGDLHPDVRPLERRPTTRSLVTRARASSRSPATRSAFDRNGNDMLLQLAKGARSSLLVGDRRGRRSACSVGGTLGLIAGYYRGGIDTRAHDALQHPARDPAVRARAVARHGARHRLRSTRAGNQHPPSSGRPAVRADLRARHRLDPDPRPHHARQHAAVVATRVRARRARPGRDQPPRHVPRGAAQRDARDVLDRAARRSRS